LLNIFREVINSYRIACLELDEETQVTLINCILRFYINNNSYEQARNFLSKSKYIENVSVHEDARYLYYLGRINCVHMNYSEAFANLTNSLRKAPDNSHGFLATVEKLLMIVELLMGEIPDISKYLKLPKIAPYVVLLRAVRKGNLSEFKEIIEKFKVLFFEDKNFNLIQRLRLIVIKVGLRKINLSYSRISLKDISEKLNLGSEKETKLVIMKAIRDGVFVAKIDNETGVVESENITDIYSTFDPQKAFYRRIEFLNNIHNEAMKGIKYPDNKDKEKKTNTLNDEDEDLGFEGQVLDL
jgi:26S proteasome regulatory subunit N3